MPVVYVAIYLSPFMALYMLFPWYASVNKAHKEGNMSVWDYIFGQGEMLVICATIDVLCNVLASLFFFEPPFLHGNITLSQRCSYWWNRPSDYWRHSLAHAVKVLTDKYEKDHIS